MKKSPLQEVKDRFESKERLVKELAPMLRRRDGESQAELVARISTAPNAKLLRLYLIETRVRDRFGNHEKLADAICKLRYADKKVDQDYRAKLLTMSTGRLLDMHEQLARKN